MVFAVCLISAPVYSWSMATKRPEKFSKTGPKSRMIQLWLVLIGRAQNRQTITYGDLSELMLRKRAPRSRSMGLGYLYAYCERKHLPLLPVIVVDKKTGRPEPLDIYPNVAKETNKVFLFDWYGIHPPSKAEANQISAIEFDKRMSAPLSKAQTD
jgi:hypothetical protein